MRQNQTSENYTTVYTSSDGSTYTSTTNKAKKVDTQSNTHKTSTIFTLFKLPNQDFRLKAIENALKKNPKMIDEANEDGLKPLTFASMNCKNDEVKLLLKFGANINEISSVKGRHLDEVTPLIASAMTGCVSVATTLVCKKANVKFTTSEGETAERMAMLMFGLTSGLGETKLSISDESKAELAVNSLAIINLLGEGCPSDWQESDLL